MAFFCNFAFCYKQLFTHLYHLMAQKSKIAFIINPISGTASKVDMPQIIEHHIDADRHDISIMFTEYAGHACELASKCVDEHYDIVVAVGGDGTVNEVARSLIHTPTALGIVPCGSGNGLARHLMLPLNLGGALDIINNAEVHTLDYGVIDDHPFFCTCGMGFDAFISDKFAKAGKRGPMTYLENVLKEGLAYKPETYELTLDGNEAETQKAFLISVANASQYGNDAYIAPQASMSDGLLDVVIMEPFDILEAPEVSFALMNKTINNSSKIKTFRAREISVRRSTPGVIHFDGDPADAPAEVRISIHHQGIRMVVNPMADRKRRQPNMMQTAFATLFNELHVVREEVTNPRKHVQALNKYIQGKLS